MSLLDGYEEHAHGIQAKLLTRLHADITKMYNDKQTDYIKYNLIIGLITVSARESQMCTPPGGKAAGSYLLASSVVGNSP
jgi:hypothetical protein